MDGYKVTDELWSWIEPLVPKHVSTYPRGGGRIGTPQKRHRFTAAEKKRQ